MKNVRGERVRERDRSATFHLLFDIFSKSDRPCLVCGILMDLLIRYAATRTTHTRKDRREVGETRRVEMQSPSDDLVQTCDS